MPLLQKLVLDTLKSRQSLKEGKSQYSTTCPCKCNVSICYPHECACWFMALTLLSLGI